MRRRPIVVRGPDRNGERKKENPAGAAGLTSPIALGGEKKREGGEEKGLEIPVSDVRFLSLLFKGFLRRWGKKKKKKGPKTPRRLLTLNCFFSQRGDFVVQEWKKKKKKKKKEGKEATGRLDSFSLSGGREKDGREQRNTGSKRGKKLFVEKGGKRGKKKETLRLKRKCVRKGNRKRRGGKRGGENRSLPG